MQSSLEPALERVRQYIAAYLRGDADAYASQWVYPACIYARGRWGALADASACRHFTHRSAQRARQQGVTGGRILELTARAEGKHAAWVDGRVSREGAVGQVIAETRAAFLVVKRGQDWRVAVCVMKD